MNYTSSSWFPLKNFTKSPLHKDWMLGATKWKGLVDSVTGKPLKHLETVFWNRTLNANVSYEEYRRVRNDPAFTDRLTELGLPLDIRV